MTTHPAYIALNKPYGVICQFSPAGNHRTLSEFGFPKGVYSVGRLDADSEGLLLLTNDNRFKTRLTDPRYGHPRVYAVQVERIPDASALDRLRRGVVIGGYRTLPANVHRMESEPDIAPRDPPIRFRKNVPTCWIQVTLREGKNRQIRRMTAAVGYPTLRLIRLEIAGVGLNDLVPGKWRFLEGHEWQPILGVSGGVRNRGGQAKGRGEYSSLRSCRDDRYSR